MSVGLVIGKFMPPHLGHQHLFDVAGALVDRLYIVVEHRPQEPMDSALRQRWVQRMAPHATVLHLHRDMPQQPSDHPQFWALWRDALLDLLPEPPTHVMASEAYGAPLAQALGATFRPVDPGRHAVPISATQVRRDPFAHWAHLPGDVKAFYTRRVSIFGPESTGKTTLSRQLADALDATWVPEYARTYLVAQGGALCAADLIPIVRGQAATEDALARQAKPWMVCDTDPLATAIWSRFLYGTVNPALEEAARGRTYHLTLVTDTDLTWEEDPVRYLPHQGPAFRDACIEALRAAGRPWALVRGQGAERLANAQRILASWDHRAASV